MEINDLTKEILQRVELDRSPLAIQTARLFEGIKTGGPDALRTFGEALQPPTEPPLTYAWVELFGHNSLGICAVREIRQYGATFCEACPLDVDGKPCQPQQVAGAAIYRCQPVSKEMALSVAKRRLGYLPARAESNSFDEFLRECCETGEGKRISVIEFHVLYNEWCDRRGFEKLGTATTTNRMTEIAGSAEGFYAGLDLSKKAREELLTLVDAEWNDHDEQQDPPAFKRDPIPAGCENCPGCPGCLTLTPPAEAQRDTPK